MSKFKVYGMSWGKGSRIIVATTSLNQVSKILNVDYTHIKNYCCETGNEYQIKIAMSEPGIPFITDDPFSNAPYKKWKGGS